MRLSLRRHLENDKRDVVGLMLQPGEIPHCLDDGTPDLLGRLVPVLPENADDGYGLRVFYEWGRPKGVRSITVVSARGQVIADHRDPDLDHDPDGGWRIERPDGKTNEDGSCAAKSRRGSSGVRRFDVSGLIHSSNLYVSFTATSLPRVSVISLTKEVSRASSG